MNINFEAIEVQYNEAIEGEIVQVVFDEDSSEDPFNRTKRYVMISQSYEFPSKPTLEWHDGEDYHGGSEVLSYKLDNDILELETTDSLSFRINHSCPKDILDKIRKFFQREFSNKWHKKA